MITLKALKAKCQKYWDAQHLQRAVLTQEPLFPLTLSKVRFTARDLASGFADIRDGVQQLRLHSKESKDIGFTLRYEIIQHRQLGRQTIPESIVFETLDDFLHFGGYREAYRQFCAIAQTIVQGLPALKVWLTQQTAWVLEYQKQWPQLLAVAAFVQQHSQPNCYLRELPIPGIDSKFLEQHKKILSEMFTVLLPESAIDQAVTSFQQHGFERRYGFKYSQPLIRLRMLDSRLAYHSLTDLSLPLSDFQSLNCPCSTIFITENKINGLAFPKVEDAMIIFGLGYGIQSLAGISWFANKSIFYWGDLDTHGFAMLSQLRGYHPNVQSLLMDQHTLQTFKVFAVEEMEDKRCIMHLPNLTAPETELYQALCNNYYGHNVRIEQERIDFDYLQHRLRQVVVM